MARDNQRKMSAENAPGSRWPSSHNVGHERHRSLGVLEMPDSVIVRLANACEALDAFRLSLTCSKIHTLLTEDYWRRRAASCNYHLTDTPSAFVQLFGILEAFCGHCSIPLLVPWQTLSERGWPILPARQYGFWPDSVGHPICRRWFCGSCCRLPQYHFIGSGYLHNWGITEHDIARAPSWVVDGTRWYRYVDVVRCFEEKARVFQEQVYVDQGQGPALFSPYHAQCSSTTRAQTTVGSQQTRSASHDSLNISTSYAQAPAGCSFAKRQGFIAPAMSNSARGHDCCVASCGTLDRGGVRLSTSLQDVEGRGGQGSLTQSGTTPSMASVLGNGHNLRSGREAQMAAGPPPKRTRRVGPKGAQDNSRQPRQTVNARQARREQRERIRQKSADEAALNLAIRRETAMLASCGASEMASAHIDGNVMPQFSDSTDQAAAGVPSLTERKDQKQEQVRSNEQCSGAQGHKDVAEARQQIIREVKREQLHDALLSQGCELDTHTSRLPQIQAWLTGDWQTLKGYHIEHLDDLVATAKHELSRSERVPQGCPQDVSTNEASSAVLAHGNHAIEHCTTVALASGKQSQSCKSEKESTEAPNTTAKPSVTEVEGIATGSSASTNSISTQTLYSHMEEMLGAAMSSVDTQDHRSSSSSRQGSADASLSTAAVDSSLVFTNLPALSTGAE